MFWLSLSFTILITQLTDKNANLGNQDTPEKRPDDVPEVQQHHVFKEQSWKSKLGDKVPQTLSLILSDDISPSEKNWRNSHYSTRIIMSRRQKGYQSLLPTHNHTCQRCSHTIWCQSTQGGLGRACRWTCGAPQQRPPLNYGICSFHGSAQICWQPPWWWWDGVWWRLGNLRTSRER